MKFLSVFYCIFPLVGALRMCREVAVINEQRKLSPSDGEARGTFAAQGTEGALTCPRPVSGQS